MGSDPYGINFPINLSGDLGEVIKEALSRSHGILSKYPEAFGIDPMNTVAVMGLVHSNVLSPADERSILIFTNMFSTQRVVDLVAKCRSGAKEIERLTEVIRLSVNGRNVTVDAEEHSSGFSKSQGEPSEGVRQEFYPVGSTIH